MLHESDPPTKYCVFHTKTELGSTCGIRAVCPRSGEMLRVSLNAEETVTVFPALFFYPKAGGRRLKH